MSYDLGLKDAITGEWLELDEPHHMRGGTYCVGGSSTAQINITYNYANHFYRVIPARNLDSTRGGGIRSIYGMTGAESIPVLESAISILGDDVDDDYWKPTEGNAKRALTQCLALARMRPDGVWDGD
jgi:hypothetical protein